VTCIEIEHETDEDQTEEEKSEDESESFASETGLHRRMACMAHISYS